MKKDCKKSAVIKAFGKLGYQVSDEREHIKLFNAVTGAKIIGVPNHRVIKGSTLTEILNRSNIDKKQFFNLV